MPINLKESNLKIDRFPQIPNDKFLAWDAADEYIINHVNANEAHYKHILLIEDEFGAIGINLKADHLYLVNDSILSQKGIIHNFEENNLDISKLSLLSPYQAFPENIDLIILKIPKVNLYLEFLLHKLNNLYKTKIPFIAGAMLKYLNPSIYELFQSYLSDFIYSLTWKKSKIITGRLAGISPIRDFKTTLIEFDLTLINFPNLFSSKRLDIGSRFFLENLEKLLLPNKISKIIDVGSANGILGLALLQKFPSAKLWLSDITYSAYESALATIEANNLDSVQIKVIIENSLAYFLDNFADLIIINPPFHQNHKVSIEASLSIFTDCARVLQVGGKLLIVANKHLGYQSHLKDMFSNVEILFSNAKFVILVAAK